MPPNLRNTQHFIIDLCVVEVFLCKRLCNSSLKCFHQWLKTWEFMANCFFEINLFVQEDDRVKRCGCELVPPRFNSFGLTCRVWTLRTQDCLSRRTASARLLLSISLIKQVSLEPLLFSCSPGERQEHLHLNDHRQPTLLRYSARKV